MAAKKIMRHASALKAQRKSLARQEQNYQVRSKIRTLTNSVLKAIGEKNVGVAKTRFVEAQAAWNKAANRGIFHQNAAARSISRLASRLSVLAKA
jgi:small subunit ribosomal protein S20